MTGKRHAPLSLSDLEVYMSDSKINSESDDNRARRRAGEYTDRPFLFWDGEGVGGQSADQGPQQYVLFGCSSGDEITGRDLGTMECIDLMFDVKRENPTALHVAFAFDYDVNMILKDMTPRHFSVLRKTNQVRWNGYRIEHVPSKWLSISRPADWDKPNGKRESIKIMDTFGFFQSSFVKAIKSYIPDHDLMVELAKIEQGKADRNKFTHDQLDMIRSYWWTEVRLGQALIEELRTLMYGAGFKINSWHGPGALANYVYSKHRIQDHKALTPEPVQDAAQYAYAGGRFELFRLGRHQGPVYSLDINSAYPWAISQLPSLVEGQWRRREYPWILPDDLAEFGMYKIEMRAMSMRKPQPLFHRSEQGNITYPSRTVGWYWTPEVKAMIKYTDPRAYRIVEAWEYVGWTTRPFETFVNDYYNTRKIMKAQKIGSEKAIKLALNSLYGKMAQRVGWEKTGGPPKWHQLEWAGWVTSLTRATLFDVLARIPWQDQIAVETDGIYTTANSDDLGITDSKELGGWEVNEYKEIMYLQSGVYAIGKSATVHPDDLEWSTKYRGLNPGALDSGSMAAHLRTLTAGGDWQPITGPDTRFNGYQISLARSRRDEGRFHDHHRRWVTIEKAIDLGRVGKRAHRMGCLACKEGLSAYDMPHDLFVTSTALGKSENMHSHRHHIPWRDDDPEPQWRVHKEDQLEGALK